MDSPQTSRENTDGRTQDGKFAPGNAIGSAGRPRGSRNRVTRAMEALLDGQGEALTQMAIDAALAGDSTALRLCLDRLIPPIKDRPISLDLPAMTSAAGVSQAAEVVLQAVGEGEITPTEANRILALVETRRKALETEELERRIERLEQANGSKD